MQPKKKGESGTSENEQGTNSPAATLCQAVLAP